ncbi:unnamed protein product [Adineta ricciae]|uniref:Uncharacterized protein n=1 Tax=Adineta ricciae TaxID=249248 RepID=A0A816G001_ADIRI|nr:unnamed protein product [Adineta ricciae]
MPETIGSKDNCEFRQQLSSNRSTNSSGQQRQQQIELLRQDGWSQYSPHSSQHRRPSSSRPPSGEQRRPRSDHLLSTLSLRSRSKHRSHSNDSRRSGSETRYQSISITKQSLTPTCRSPRRRRSADPRGLESDMNFSARNGSKAGSITILRLNDSDDGLRTSGSRRSSIRKSTSAYKTNDSTDSDMEGVSSPPLDVLRKTTSNHATSFVPYKSHSSSSSRSTKCV